MLPSFSGLVCGMTWKPNLIFAIVNMEEEDTYVIECIALIMSNISTASLTRTKKKRKHSVWVEKYI